MTQLIWIIVILTLLLTCYSLGVKKKKEKKKEELILVSDGELRQLKVYFGGNEIKAGSTVKVKEKGCFSVKGFNLRGDETILYVSKLSWHASCGEVHWNGDIGTENCVSCTRGKIRQVWIRYANGVTFSWKIDFGD